MRIKTLIWILLLPALAYSQNTLELTILDEDNLPLPLAQVHIKELKKGVLSNLKGEAKMVDIPSGKHVISVSYVGYTSIDTLLAFNGNTLKFTVGMQVSSTALGPIDIIDSRQEGLVYDRLKSIDGVAIYAAKKNEVIDMNRISANTSGNNARQIFARVPGINVWESDCAGLQLGVGARGLSPDRTANFNTRQNGYDMAADALGYPESYYAPPMQAVERIEIVRGAASLQYGTQFGGMINLKLRKGNPEKKLSGKTMNTYNSVGYFNTYNELGGQSGKLNYYSFVNYRTGSGARPNTDFDANTNYIRLGYDFTKKLSLSAEYTYMNYDAQQAGGLTDVQFEQDPYQSLRERNWFKVRWNLMAVNLDYRFSEKTVLNSRTFALVSTRQALGNQAPPTRVDAEPYSARDLIVDYYRNIGNETRLLHKYKLNGRPTAFVVGARFYKGHTEKAQGYGSNGSDPNFSFVDSLKKKSDYLFPSTNWALFAENVFNINTKLSITPGLRYENIQTQADGYFDSSIKHPITGEIVVDSSTYELRENNRSFLLAGIGAAYHITESLEMYSNISQNYRAITFNDMRVVSPSAAVDPNLKDERGFNLDLGVRGNINGIFTIDAGLFWLSYTNKIGSVLTKHVDNFFGERIIRLTTNVGDAEIVGAEVYVETDLLNLLHQKPKSFSVSHFLNLGYTVGYYHGTTESSIEGKRVESVPMWNIKTGVQARYQNLKAAVQFTYLSDQYSEATNAEYSPTGIYGLIPSYWVLDFSMTYELKRFSFEGGVNNLTNNAYFTRRAVGYPGPGIITAAPINFYVGLGFRF